MLTNYSLDVTFSITVNNI